MLNADDTVGRANGDGEVTVEALASIRQKITEWNDRASEFWDRRSSGERARFCVWEGQSDDGRLWAKNNGNKTPAPFNGASDQRIRWADAFVLDKSAVLLNALAVADIKVKATGAAAGRTARNLTVMLRWMINNMGAEWLRQWMILTSHYLADSPACALMGVRWVREERMEYKTVTGEELIGMYAAARTAAAEREGVAPTEALGDGVLKMRLLLEEGEGETEEAEALLMNAFGVKAKTARRIIADVQRDGESEFPVTVYGDEGPELTAMRFGEDFIIPDNCVNFERCGIWFRTEWLTRPELEAKEAEDGWDAEFIRKTLESGSNGRPVISDALSFADEYDAKKDLYQVVYVYYTALNEDGVRAKYETVLSHADETAFGRRMMRGTRGRWPASYFQREVNNRFLLSSRGIPEIASPHQGAAKKLRDTCTDNGVVGGLPPYLAKGTNAQRNDFLGPMQKVDLRINEDLSWMNPPQYPAAAQRTEDKIGDELRDYFGEPRKDGDEQAPGLRRRAEAMWFMAQVYDVLRAMVELAQDNASDEWLAAVTDEKQGIAGLRRTDVTGRFRVQVAFNADDLDQEKVIAKAQVVAQTLNAIDRNRRIDPDPVIDVTFRSLYPDISEDSLITADKASVRELEEEARNLISIRAGVMPTMDTEGNWNYQARLQWYQELKEQNPSVFADMPPDKLAMLEEWLKALSQQAVQFGANRTVGRSGAAGVEG